MRKLTGALAVASAMLLLTPIFAAEPIATVETNLDGISLDVIALTRKGSVLTLKWAVRNDGEKSTEVKFHITGNVLTYVVDEESGTKYYVLTDKEGNAVASSHNYLDSTGWGIELKALAGKSSRLWMKFPAPPPEVKTVTLFFNKAVEPLEDVPITDK